MALFLVGFYAITLTRKDMPMENPSLLENGKKKRWTPHSAPPSIKRKEEGFLRGNLNTLISSRYTGGYEPLIPFF